MRAAAALLACGLLGGAAVQAADVGRLFGVVTIAGPIENGDADRLGPLLDAGTRLVAIRSPGGNVQEALRVARLLRDSGKPLEVRGPCVSACAGVIVPAAKQRRVRAGGFLAFHAGTEGWVRAAMPLLLAHEPATPEALAIYAPQRDKLRQDHDALMGQWRQLMLESGVAWPVFEAMFELTAQPVTGVQIDDAKRTAHVQFGGPSRCDFWLPDAEMLAAMGIAVPGYVRPDLEGLARQLGVPAARLYGGPLPLPPTAPSGPACPGG